jgi:dihydrofolate reductase
MLTGRRTFERANGWGGQHPCDVPAFVVTHNVPDGLPRSGSTVQFVTDGIESAAARAKSAADPKSVGVHGAQTIQQCLDAGVLDEIHIDFRAASSTCCADGTSGAR